MILDSLFSGETASVLGIGTDIALIAKSHAELPTSAESRTDNSAQILSVASLRLKITGSSTSVSLGIIGDITIEPSGCITGSLSRNNQRSFVEAFDLSRE